MSSVTLRVLQGADRGRVFADLRPPITIGREEGNTIQLNDERVSRFHVKIQEDNDRLVLTDLDSTNGTKINGNECQLRILRYGDILAIGRSVLLVGSREQIASRLQEIGSDTNDPQASSGVIAGGSDSLDFDLSTGMNSSGNLFGNSAQIPSIPERLSPSQAAQLSEVLEHFHAGLQHIIEAVVLESQDTHATVPIDTWQAILQIQARLSELIRKIGDPGDSPI